MKARLAAIDVLLSVLGYETLQGGSPRFTRIRYYINYVMFFRDWLRLGVEARCWLAAGVYGIDYY